MSPHFSKRAKKIIGSIIIASTLLWSGNFALAAAPIINSIEVSETSVKVVFDQAVVTTEDTSIATYTYSAGNLANFGLPVLGEYLKAAKQQVFGNCCFGFVAYGCCGHIFSWFRR